MKLHFKVENHRFIDFLTISGGWGGGGGYNLNNSLKLLLC